MKQVITAAAIFLCLLTVAAAEDKTITVEIRQPHDQRSGWERAISTGPGKKVRVTVALRNAKLLEARSSTSFAGTVSNVPSPACMSTWWCNLIAGYATTTPIYNSSIWFVIQDADLTYIAREDRATTAAAFTINSGVEYGLLGDSLYLVDDSGKPHQMILMQKVLRDSVPIAAK